MELTTVWFLAIAGLWIGYFVLEGFDFGVGMLLWRLGRDESERRTVLSTIGPVWDGNEVWLIVAAGATFAAFPEWYATLFSAFYLPLFAILIALIFRGVALEYRSKQDDLKWRNRCDTAIVLGSLIPALLWGITFANLLRGVPLDEQHEYAGGPADLLAPFALLGGAVFTALFVTHGAIFLALKTDGEVRCRANRIARQVGAVTAVLAIMFLAWAQLIRGDGASAAVAASAATALLAGLLANRFGREGWAFAGTAVAVALTVASLFTAMFPAVMPSTLASGGLTVTNAAATAYTLRILTVLGALLTPFVLLYQGWTYWVFRRRVS